MSMIMDRIAQLLDKYDKRTDEIIEWKGEDFNPMDSSGGNFDDAYELGYEHGEDFGAYRILSQLMTEFKDV